MNDIYAAADLALGPKCRSPQTKTDQPNFLRLLTSVYGN